MFVLLLGSALFVAGGIWLWPRKPVIGGLAVLVFGFAAIVLAVCLHPRSAFLTLTSEGFTFAALFRKNYVAWSTVQSFATVRIGLNRMVGWNYVPEFRESTSVRRANLAMTGIEAALPDTYGMTADELCALMNEVRERHENPAPS